MRENNMWTEILDLIREAGGSCDLTLQIAGEACLGGKRIGYGIRITGVHAECANQRVIRVLNLEPVRVSDLFQRLGDIDKDGVSEWQVKNATGEICIEVDTSPYEEPITFQTTCVPVQVCSPQCPGALFGQPYHFADCPNRR